MSDYLEKFKQLDNVYEPDVRNTYYITTDLKTGKDRPFALEDIYAIVEGIKLKETVPIEVRSSFNIAKNIALYIWFCYPFHQVCEMKAFATVEMALKAKYGKGLTLRNMLEKAVADGLLTDDGFSICKNAQPGQNEHSKNVARITAEFRNHLAHGGTGLSPTGWHALQKCAEIINQLFP